MALPAFVEAADLATWMGTTITNEPRAEAILAAASTLVRTETGRAWVDDDGNYDDDVDETRQETIQTVVKLIAERVYTNPRGVLVKSSGPFSETVAAWAAFGLMLTEQERSLLGAPNNGGIPGLTSVRVEAPRLAAGVPRPGVWDWDE